MWYPGASRVDGAADSRSYGSGVHDGRDTLCRRLVFRSIAGSSRRLGMQRAEPAWRAGKTDQNPQDDVDDTSENRYMLCRMVFGSGACDEGSLCGGSPRRPWSADSRFLVQRARSLEQSSPGRLSAA